MYGNKKLLTVVACILIFALAFVPVRRSYAFAPAIPAAVYYAIGATGAACGIYAANRDSLDYIVSDYWNKTSDYVKKQWSYTTAAGWMGGKMIVDGSLTTDVLNYLVKEHKAGAHSKVVEKSINPDELESNTGSNIMYKNIGPVTLIEKGTWQYSDGEYGIVTMVDYHIVDDGTGIYNHAGNGNIVSSLAGCASILIDRIEGGYVYIKSKRAAQSQGAVQYVEENRGRIALGGINGGSTVLENNNYIGDNAGFGSALAPDREVKVPCPPVPPTEWPDSWIDDLERDLNNTTADRYVETMDEDYDWYIDKDGHIYKKPKGEPPKKDHDTKMVPPIPPPYQPVHPEPGEPGPATPDQPWVPAEPCPYCPAEPGPGPECPNPYCPNHPQPQTPPQYDPNSPPEPCPYCPADPDPEREPCPNPYCPNNPAPQTPPAPKPQPGQPGGPPTPDDRYIDFEPLKKLPHIFTMKFPFSLPWDLKRGVESLEGGQWDRKFQIAACGEYWPEMTVDVSMFDPIAGITRVVFLIIFDFALIFATRRLMGGDV